MTKKDLEKFYAEKNYIIDCNEFDADEYEAAKEIAVEKHLNKYVLTISSELDSIYVFCSDAEIAVNAILASIVYINGPDDSSEYVENYVKSNIYIV